MDRSVLDEQYRSVRDAHVVSGWWAEYSKRVRLKGPALLVILATFALAGFPRGRLSVLLGMIVAGMTWEGFQACRVRRRESSRHQLLTTLLGLLAPGAIAVGLTGGLASPLAVILVGVPLSAIVLFGRDRATAVVLSVWALVVAALALEPASWAGPPLARPFAAAVTVEALVVVLFFLMKDILQVSDANLRAHAQLDRLREEGLIQVCERARSLQSIGAKVAHELKNPLAAIKGLVQLLGRGGREQRDRERIDVIASEVARMEAILRDYLSYSRPLEDLQPQPVELGALADDVIATLAGRAETAGVMVSRRGDATVFADRRRLKEALINLVQNAIEACAYGSAVDLDIRQHEDYVEVTIADTGHGIAPEVLPRIGTPFFTTRDNGTGLGVVLARSVIVHHGGALRFESTLGRGTRVLMQLPLDGKRTGNGQSIARG